VCTHAYRFLSKDPLFLSNFNQNCNLPTNLSRFSPNLKFHKNLFCSSSVVMRAQTDLIKLTGTYFKIVNSQKIIQHEHGFYSLDIMLIWISIFKWNGHGCWEPVRVQGENFFFRAPSKDGQAKNLYTKLERLTVSSGVTWAWFEKINLYN
jgi:hypothetical protein